MTDPLPHVRLKPKIDARKIRFGFPWVYADELVLDRRTRALPPGQLAILQDNDRSNLALVSFNGNSKLAARVLDYDLAANIDATWIEGKLKAALDLRERLYDAPFYRLVHAEGDGLPGVVIDRFGDVAVFQPNAVWADARKSEFAQALKKVCGIQTVVLNGTGRSRAAEGLPELREALLGDMPDKPVAVSMNGATYLADLGEGQKTGLFFDQRDNHAFAARFAAKANVLDVFSHVGGFGLAALANGATQVTCVDGSQAALDLVDKSAAVMARTPDVITVKADAFDFLEKANVQGQTFDVVICDPPAFAPGKKALQSGLRAYERVARLAAPLVRNGGLLGLCSCSHAATLEKFRAASIRGIGRAAVKAQLLHTGTAGPDHPLHLGLSDAGYLKALFFRVQ